MESESLRLFAEARQKIDDICAGLPEIEAQKMALLYSALGRVSGTCASTPASIGAHAAFEEVERMAAHIYMHDKHPSREDLSTMKRRLKNAEDLEREELKRIAGRS